MEAVAEEGKLDSTLTLNGGVDGETAVGKSDSTADSATAVVEKQDSNASGSTSDVKTDNPEASGAGCDGISDRKDEETSQNFDREESYVRGVKTDSSSKTDRGEEGRSLKSSSLSSSSCI